MQTVRIYAGDIIYESEIKGNTQTYHRDEL